MSSSGYVVQVQALPEFNLPVQSILKQLAVLTHHIELMFLEIGKTRNLDLESGDILVLPANHSCYHSFRNHLPPRLKDRVFFYSGISVPTLVFVNSWWFDHRSVQIRHNPDPFETQPTPESMLCAFQILTRVFPDHDRAKIQNEMFPDMPSLLPDSPMD